MTVHSDRAAVDTAELAACAHALADAAAQHSLPLFRNAGLAVDNKSEGGFDPVTEADRAAERAMRRILQERRPDDAILGEEYGPQAGTSGLTWVLDPIDGTRAFMAGVPVWGTLVAVSDAQGPILGLIDQPFTGERWMGGPGEASWRRGAENRPLATRPTVRLTDAILCTTFPELGTAHEGAAFRRVSAGARLTRYGLDCYGYGLIALGGVDLVIEAGLAAYDVCAPIAVIEAAGGVVTNWEGGPAHAGGRVVAAGTPELHREVLEVLNSD